MPELGTELQGVEWLDAANEPTVGARVPGHNQHDAQGEWSITSHVIEREPEQVFAWAVDDPVAPSAT